MFILKSSLKMCKLSFPSCRIKSSNIDSMRKFNWDYGSAEIKILGSNSVTKIHTQKPLISPKRPRRHLFWPSFFYIHQERVVLDAEHWSNIIEAWLSIHQGVLRRKKSPGKNLSRGPARSSGDFVRLSRARPG